MEQVIEALQVADREQMVEIAKSELGHDASKSQKKDDNLRKELIELAESKMTQVAAPAAVGGKAPAQQNEPKEAPVPKQRLLVNKDNGRKFIYTEALAKLKHMVEIEE